ncbi:MAG: ABC transporter substrate-binding protein [Treponema sp.]|uniref:ABC transporter substrate-binding protein n=1 Tax=Treponema sp. TaxID=166 RepID=UPI0025DBE07C|nr:ABC transporter substrate-binding protein [Treponema sp.]MBQ9281848.1 ABC transporter substrate-binding protein [Treponema sp.]
MKMVKSIAALTIAVLSLIGCNSKGSTIKIGSVGPLSGQYAVYGGDCKNGIELAVNEINAAGGINGKQIELIAEDDEGAAEKSVSAYKKLVTKDGVKLIIGSLTSGCAIAISPLAQAQKIVQIAPAATAPALTDAGNYIFRACYDDPFQGTVGGKFASETLGAKKAAILYDISNDYSVGLTENFKASFEANGGEIISLETYSTGDKDFNAQLTKIKNANPDVVYLPDYYSTVALIVKQLRAQGINTPIVGADGWDGLTENAGDEVLNGFYSNHYAADSTEPKVQNFVTNYKAKYSLTPTSFAALGYDSVYMLRDAIEKAGSSDSEAVRTALEATNGDYVTGHLTFNEKHNPVKGAVIVELVKGADGKLTTVYNTTVNP